MKGDTRLTRLARPTTTRRSEALPWRRIAASVVAFSLLSLLTISLASATGAKGRSAATEQPKVYPASGRGTALAHGIVDMTKLPILQPHAVTTAQTPPLPAPDALTPTQRQAYNDRAQKSSSPLVTGLPQTRPPSAAGPSPSFVGGHSIPLLVKQFEGLSSTQAGGGTGNAAIATDLSYVMEGVDNALAIYRASNGSLAFGPYSPASFFAPVYHAGDTLAFPQMYYDTMRDHWIVVYLEIDPSRIVTYLDVAVSQSISPSQPTPGAQYNLYQFGTNFKPSHTENSYCDNETLGVDYWGLYISCIEYRNTVFVGNTVLAINKAPMLTGAANPQTYSWNDALKITSDAGPSLEISPALEEGVQDAEFIIATDAGYGTNSRNLSVCALTNQSNIATVAPTLSCVHHDLSITYVDPIPAHQPSGGTINVGYGTKQVYYKAGRLFMAWTVSNLILWAEIRPVLDFQAPRQMYRVDEIQAAYAANLDLGLGASDDVYTPSIIGTDEDDIVLAYNASGSSRYPSIYYSGRKAADEVRFMGYPDHGAAVVAGTHSTTALWGKYSACAISLNSVTRGGVWCVGEYTGSLPDPGWNTRLFNLRAE